MKLRILLASIVLCLSACAEQDPSGTVETVPPLNTEPASLDDLVAKYLLLELSMGQHDAGHVDAYFGPARYSQQAEAEGFSLQEIAQQAAALSESLKSLPDTRNDQLHQLRIKGLELRLKALQTRIGLNRGADIEFDDESERLFAAISRPAVRGLRNCPGRMPPQDFAAYRFAGA
jgi:hypothetical protein